MRPSTQPALLLAALALSLGQPALAIWPFKAKRFTTEVLIDAGSLGLEGFDGRIVAIGDWDGDQQCVHVLGVHCRPVHPILRPKDSRPTSMGPRNVILASTIRRADISATFSFHSFANITRPDPIVNVIPGDFDHDGQQDLLIMSDEREGGWWGDGAGKLGMTVHIGQGLDGLRNDIWTLPAATLIQPLVYDASLSLKPSLLGIDAASPTAGLRSWTNDGSAMTLQHPPLQSLSSACNLASPHSSAFIDIDGDCLPDLVLHCERAHRTQRSIQVWLNRGSSGFVLAKSYDLPRGSGPLSFADVDRDGTMDIVFPTCARVSSTSGVGTDCSINIMYNKQVPVCSTEGSQFAGSATAGGSLKCRGFGDLCLSDSSFEFTLDSSSEYFSSVRLSAIIPGTTGFLLHPPGEPNIPLPLRLGDYDVDGFPDVLAVTSNSTARHGGVFRGSSGTQARVIRNVKCGKGVAGCDEHGRGRRGFVLGQGKGWEVLDYYWDVEGASWIDVDDDGSLDIMLQRSGEQDQKKVSFVQNNFYHDAFFLKAQTLNGACDGACQAGAAGKKHSGLGVNVPGATFKFTLKDTLGRRIAQQAAQLPQSAYHALGTPYSWIGLGRTNNYVERLFVGASLPGPQHSTFVDSLVPNSQIIVNPPFPGTDDADPAPGLKRPTDWRSELFLHPGDWIPWVSAAVVGTVFALGMVVVGLHEREKKEDEMERRRALHAINFQAL